MSEAEHILTRITQWATREEPIRAMILEGSRAAPIPPDELADFDLSVFTRTHEPYTQNDDWLSTIGQVWVAIPEEYEWHGETVLTRLVIFKDGVKVDFSFVSVHELATLANSDDLDAGYQVLLDKDGATEQFPQPTFSTKHTPLPPQQDFVNLVCEFWFEAYHVAKYLKREELWLVKFRDWGAKELLLKMMEWQAQAQHGWAYNTAYLGKHMQAWVGPSIWQALHCTFAHFERDDSWASLLASMNLFRRLATDVAQRLGYPYPVDVDRNLTGFILRLKG